MHYAFLVTFICYHKKAYCSKHLFRLIRDNATELTHGLVCIEKLQIQSWCSIVNLSMYHNEKKLTHGVVCIEKQSKFSHCAGSLN